MCTRPGVALTVVDGALIGLIGILSLRLVRSRLPYEAWCWVHLSADAAVALTVPHQLCSGSTFVVVRRDAFVCGPPQWAQLVRRSLHQVGVPASLVNLERFSW
jgi:predicted ferric reductase